jgi:hypothetical protein
MMRSRPPTASAVPATIFRALAILNSGISEAGEPDSGDEHKQEADFGDDHAGAVIHAWHRCVQAYRMSTAGEYGIERVRCAARNWPVIWV